MAKRKKSELSVGDHVRVPFGGREYTGTVTEVSGYRVYVTLVIEGADDPVTSLYRAVDLVPA
jgi:primosomal protein N'